MGWSYSDAMTTVYWCQSNSHCIRRLSAMACPPDSEPCYAIATLLATSLASFAITTPSLTGDSVVTPLRLEQCININSSFLTKALQPWNTWIAVAQQTVHAWLASGWHSWCPLVRLHNAIPICHSVHTAYTFCQYPDISLTWYCGPHPLTKQVHNCSLTTSAKPCWTHGWVVQEHFFSGFRFHPCYGFIKVIKSAILT